VRYLEKFIVDRLEKPSRIDYTFVRAIYLFSRFLSRVIGLQSANSTIQKLADSAGFFCI